MQELDMINEWYRGRSYAGKWCFGSLIVFDEETVFIMPPYKQASTMSYGALFAANAVRVDPGTVSRATGIQDKKKQLIFGGDILAFDLPEADGSISRSFYQVYWADGAWRTQCGRTVPELLTNADAAKMEIVGTDTTTAAADTHNQGAEYGA